MSDNLKYVRKSLNSTILKHGKMSSADKDRLYQTVIHHKVSKKRFSIAPVLSIAAIACFTLFIGSFVYKQIENKENPQNDLALINNQEEEDDKTTSKNEEQKNNNSSNLASFLYELKVMLQENNMSSSPIEDSAKEVGDFAKDNAYRFASIQKEEAILKKLQEIGKLGESLQEVDTDEKRINIMSDLDYVANQLVVIAEAKGIIDERNNIIKNLEYENLETWLKSVKESIHAESFKPYGNREAYERNIGNGANLYAKHYAALEDDTAIKDQLKEIAEVTNKIKKEEGEEKRTELLNTLDLMIDQLLEDR
ncbi:MAG TPA: hypothetical protein VNR61_15475 [Niallia sp.]|nr:hypothetical protein [Niallia sp.]